MRSVKYKMFRSSNMALKIPMCSFLNCKRGFRILLGLVGGNWEMTGFSKMETQFIPSKTCIVNESWHVCSHQYSGQLLAKFFCMPKIWTSFFLEISVLCNCPWRVPSHQYTQEVLPWVRPQTPITSNWRQFFSFTIFRMLHPERGPRPKIW